MNVVIIDGQGGHLGQLIVEANIAWQGHTEKNN